MVAALGGPADFVEQPGKYLAQAPVVRPIHARGILTALDTFAIGNAIIELGGGRRKVGAALDMAVGFSEFAPLGTQLDEHRPLAFVHAANEAAAEKVSALVLDACTTSSEAPEPNPVIVEVLSANS
jgi:thymidine phosphorylase